MSSIMRISGLASGMDIDQMVSDLMKAQRMKVNSIEQNKQILEWQQEDYRNINTDLRSLRDVVADMRLQSTFLAHKATSSNQSIVTVSANSAAIDGTHTIKVDQLAKAASITSFSKIGSTGNYATLNDQLDSDPETDYGVLDFEINGVVFKMDAQIDSIYGLVNRINNHSAAGVSLNTTQRASDSTAQVQELKLTDDALTEGLTITVGDKKIALWNRANSAYESETLAKEALGADYLYDISGVNFDTADKIVQDIVDNQAAPTGALWERTGTGVLTITSDEVGAANAVSATVSGGQKWNVRASYDATVDRFFLTTSETGDDQQLKLVDNELSRLLKLTNGNGNIDTSADVSDFPSGVIASGGQNAHVVIDDLSYTEYTSNQVTLNGVTYNLHDTSATNITVTVQRDTDSIYNAVVNFIEKYNEIVGTVEDKLSEKRYRDYKYPLSDVEREKLTDKQIDQWIEKARSGMLRNDQTLSTFRNKFRTTMSAAVPGATNGINSLAAVGITTTIDYWSAKLEYKEDALRKAIESNPQGVMEMFTKQADDYNDKGIAQRLYDDLTGAINTIIDKAGGSGFEVADNSVLGKRIGDYEDDIKDWEDRLKMMEDRYYRQFTAMEKAINQMNQQSAWLMQQFGTG